MTNDAITQRIYNKSDRDLRAELENSIKWVWDQTGHTADRPKESEVHDLNKAMSGTGLPEFKSIPWIGATNKQFVETAFLYLRDRRRAAAIHDFMQKVEAVNEIITD